MHEGKHGILDGVDDIDDVFGKKKEHDHDHEHGHNHDHGHGNDHDGGTAQRGTNKRGFLKWLFRKK